MQVNSKRERTNIFNTNTNWLLTLNCWREPIHVRARWFDLPNLVNFLLHILCFKEHCGTKFALVWYIHVRAHTHTRNLSYRIGINLNFRIVYKLNSTFTNGLNFVFKVKLVHIPFFSLNLYLVHPSSFHWLSHFLRSSSILYCNSIILLLILSSIFQFHYIENRIAAIPLLLNSIELNIFVW